MIINRIEINNQYVDFSKKNLIFSEKNSVGKTTLIRLILFSLGFSVPSTKGVDFKKLIVKVYLKIENKEYLLIRQDKSIDVYEDTEYLETFSTMSDEGLSSILFGIDNSLVLDNILATFYFDQEKGWTLLNRGKVIGGISFNIEQFLEGVGSSELRRYREDILTLNRNISFYRQMKKIVEINDDEARNIGDFNWSSQESNENALRTAKLEIEQLNKQIKQLQEVRVNNDKMIKMISDFKLVVKSDDGTKIRVSRENIDGYDINSTILNVRIANLKRQWARKNIEYDKISDKLKDVELLSMDSKVDRFKQSISDLNMTPQGIEEILKGLKIRKRSINKKVKNLLNNSTLISELYNLIKNYSIILGVDKDIDATSDFILTSNLKRYSGAILHLIVFAYRLALLKLLEKHFEIKSPIILDSPLAGELDKNNVEKMFNLLNTEFADYQILVASINPLANVNWDNKIVIKNTLFDSLEELSLKEFKSPKK